MRGMHVLVLNASAKKINQRMEDGVLTTTWTTARGSNETPSLPGGSKGGKSDARRFEAGAFGVIGLRKG